MRKEKRERSEPTFFQKIKSSLGDFFYGIGVKLHGLHPNKQKKKTMGSRRRGDIIFYTLMALLPILQFCVFWFGINFRSLFLAFQKYVPSKNGFDFAGLKNFKDVINNLFTKNSSLQLAFTTSIKLFFIGLIIPPFSLFFAYYMNKKLFGAEFFKVMLYLPSVLSGMIMALLYQYFMDQVIPGIALKYFNKNILPLLQTSETRLVTAWFFGFWFNIGGGFLIYTSVMSRVPESVVEYAFLDGIKPFQEFIYIIFPLIFPTWSTYFVVGISGIFSGSLNLYEFFGTNSKTVQTMGYHSFVLVMSSNGYASYPYASALGLLCTVVSVPLVFLARWGCRKIDPEVSY